MNRLLKKAVCGMLVVTGAIASVGMFSACETKTPKVAMEIEFNGETYTLEYKLYREIAPKTVNHFLYLADSGYYNDVIVHDYDATGLRLYTGAYKYDASNEDDGFLEYQDYYTKVKGYEELKPFPHSVWTSSNKETPTYTLYGEFTNNKFSVKSGTLAQTFGSLTMYYSEKVTETTVEVERSDGTDTDEKPYKYNSATSQFFISLSTTENKSSDYCTFATLADKSVSKLESLLEAIQAEEDFTETYTLEIDNDDRYVADYDNTATYAVPVKPITIKSVNVKKW